ncbi:hypothetical protein KRMM14A1259_07470 [Krasilnikovia sp. MM14-A1259]
MLISAAAATPTAANAINATASQILVLTLRSVTIRTSRPTWGMMAFFAVLIDALPGYRLPTDGFRAHTLRPSDRPPGKRL